MPLTGSGRSPRSRPSPVTVTSCLATVVSARQTLDRPVLSRRTICCSRPPSSSVSPKFPLSRLVNAFDQVVEPLITEITCLRSQELRLFHLVNAYIGSAPVGTTG